MQHRVDAGPGRAFHLSPGDGMAEVCGRVQEVLNALQRPKSMSREEVFKEPILWSAEIRSTCGQAIKYYESILVLVKQELYGPAGALSRSIHEASFRLEYLKLNEEELKHWMDWQFRHDYYFYDDCLKYEPCLSESTRQEFERRRQEALDLLGTRPDKCLGDYWKPAGEIRKGITANPPEGYDPEGYKKRLNRLLFKYPSTFVHIRWAYPPTGEYVVDGTRANLLFMIQLAMELCRDKELVPACLSGEIEGIITTCKRLRSV